MWFDASTIEPSGATSQFPVGRHPVIIRSSSQVQVKDKPGEGMLVLQLEVIDGPNKGLTGPYRLNLWNASQQAKEIAAKQLSAICHVVGFHKLVDTTNMCSEIFGKPFIIVVSQQTGDPRYTQIDGVLDMGGNQAKMGQIPTAPPANAQPMQPQTPSAPPSGPSWGAAPPQGSGPVGGAPSWQAAGQPQQPQAPQAPAQPSWGASPANPQPQAPAAPQQPSWSSAPVGGGSAPPWANR